MRSRGRRFVPGRGRQISQGDRVESYEQGSTGVPDAIRGYPVSPFWFQM